VDGQACEDVIGKETSVGGAPGPHVHGGDAVSVGQRGVSELDHAANSSIGEGLALMLPISVTVPRSVGVPVPHLPRHPAGKASATARHTSVIFDRFVDELGGDRDRGHRQVEPARVSWPRQPWHMKT
jgi:hypothetical protein